MLEIVGLGILPIVVVNIVNPEKLQEFLYEKLDLIATLINENTSITLIFIYLIFFFFLKIH